MHLKFQKPGDASTFERTAAQHELIKMHLFKILGRCRNEGASILTNRIRRPVGFWDDIIIILPGSRWITRLFDVADSTITTQ